jgi:TRAP-type C4-dicarboxylate transport system substrate-binding protein
MTAAGATAAAIPSPFIGRAQAQQPITLRVHQFLPAQAPVPKNFIAPWAQKVEKDSGGRLKVELYPSMQLGGTAPQLFDQVKDGVVDIAWTLPGYTANRFPRTEVIELPFVAGDGEQNSKALWGFYQKHLTEEFKDVHMLAMHTNGPFHIHTKGRAVAKLDDMKGLKLRGTSRVVNKLIEQLGATPIGMPVPGVPDAISKGIIDGALLPWELMPSMRLHELVTNHTVFSGNRSLCVVAFVYIMNKNKYASLPPDLKKVIDDNSGAAASAWAGKAQNDGDAPGLEMTKARGNRLVTIDAGETKQWKAKAATVIDAWISEMKAKGIDGATLLADWRTAIAAHAGSEG